MTGTGLAATYNLTLQTFSTSGNKLDSLYVGGECWGDTTYIYDHSVIIQNDRWILDIDSTWHFVSRNYDHPDSLVVERSSYFLEVRGRFRKSNKERTVVYLSH
jgi:hypothetical protein